MCGACGGGPSDWADGLVGGAYERAVVARALSAASSRLRVGAGPSGWMFAVAGRPPRLLRTFDALLDAAVGAGVTVFDAASFPRHRALSPDRRSVPRDRRLDGEDEGKAWVGARTDTGLASDGGAPDRALLDLIAASVTARTGRTEVRLPLVDAVGPWTLLVRASP